MKIQYPHIMIARASAGSGKTHNLTLRYIQTLLRDSNSPSSVKNIIALTFTNKAANEMRRRIIEWLKNIILEEKIENNAISHIISPLKVKLFNNEEVNLEVVNKEINSIKKYIEETFTYILRNFDDFKVSTIDSFNVFIIKSLAFKLNLPPDFEVIIDNYDSSFYNSFQEIFTDIFEDILYIDTTREIFDNFIENNFHMINEWIPSEKTIYDNIKIMWKKELEKGLILNFIDRHKEIERLETSIKESVISLLDKIEEKKINSKFINALKKSINSFTIDIKSLKNWIKKDDYNGLINKDYINDENAIAIIDKFFEIKKDMIRLIEYKSEEKSASLYHIFNLFKEKIKIFEEKNSILPISELNIKLKTLLNNFSENFSSIESLYFYLTERYNHFLIDEFQDTNSLQWKNLKILIDEALSKDGSLFIVGDEKQSIYGWRGTNYKIFQEIDKKIDINFPSIDKEKNLYYLPLIENRRSDEIIVNFNNRLFSTQNILKNSYKILKDDKDGEIKEILENELTIFNSSKQIPFYSNKKGYVYAEIFKKRDYKDKDINEEIKKIFSQKLKEILSHFNYKDIAILTRKNDEIATVIKWLYEFKNNNSEYSDLKVESKITVSIKDSHIINEIISFLKFLSSPLDNNNFLSFLTGDIFTRLTNLNKKELLKWVEKTSDSETPLYIKFKNDYPEIWEKYIEYFFQRVSYLPLYEFLNILLKEWNIYKNFSDYIPHFLKLLEIIHSNEKNNNLIEFLELWNSTPDESDIFLIKTSENINAIKILTIHKAKGLAFPAVFLIYLGDESNKQNYIIEEKEDNIKMYYITQNDTLISKKLNSLYYHNKIKSYIEEINNLYVATTRAKNALLIFRKSNNSQDGKGNFLENAILDLINNDNEEKNQTKYETGSLSHYKKEKIKEDISLDLFNEIINNNNKDLNWLNLIKIKLKSPTEITKNKFTLSKYGELFHYILSLVEFYPDSDIEKKINLAIHKFNYPDKEHIKKDIYNFFNTKDFAQFFSKDNNLIKVLREQEFIDIDGSLKRIDRLLIYKNEIKIIDFKTGEIEERKHFHQMQEYINILKKIYPEKNIKAYLLYTDNKKLKVVEDEQK